MIISAKCIRRYKAILTSFFSFLHETTYKKNHEFTDEQLHDVTHEEVLNWFKFKCFGTVSPLYDDKLKAKYRKDSVLYWKKALSYFLSNAQTRSDEMNRLIKYIGQLQMRKRGKASQARNALKDAGFQYLIKGLKQDHDSDKKKDGKSQYRMHIRKYGIPAMLCFQFAMIGRVDDCTQVLAENLQCHDQFPTYALKSKMTWSKNVMDERDAPWQILLGSLLTLYCVFVNVGIWLEIQLENTPGAHMSPYVFSLSNDFSIPSGGKKASTTASRMIAAVFRDKFYEGLKVGTHSIRKFATTHCRNMGVSKDDVESRGRWRDGRRVANRYEDPTLPFVDAKACEGLCQGGACTYVAQPGCITQEFLCSYVVPAIASKFGANVAIILGSAVMWTIFSSNSDMVPEVIRARVLRAYDALPNKLPNGENPIERRTLVVAGEGSNFILASTSNKQQDHNETAIVPVHQPVGGTALRNVLNATMSQLTDVRQGQIEVVDEVKKRLNEIDGRMTQFEKTLRSELKRISRQPHIMLQHAAANAATNVAPNHVPAPIAAHAVAHPEPEQQMDMGNGDLVYHAAGLHATLSPKPPNLYSLWQEYYLGIDGRKPAKDFSLRERGGPQKVTYCRRKKFWLLVVHLINLGNSADGACKKIYDAYGHGETVTSILTKIAKDKANGTIPRSLQ
jgi:hypothetical protein